MRRLDHTKAIKLRMLGKSYNEIAKDLGVGKSSLSYWLRNLKLPLEVVKILEKKSNYPREKFAEYNKRKHERVQSENKEIKEIFSKKIKPVTDYELLLIGTALYWGEGCKRHSGKHGYYASLVNSDPDIIRVFLRFIREILCIPEEKIKPRIHIHPNITKESAVDFWTKVVNIPKDKFYFTTQVSVASKGKRPKNFLPYGTIEIRVSNRKRFFQILGLINGLIKQAT